MPPETVFDTFYDAKNNRYLEIQLGTSENKNGLFGWNAITNNKFISNIQTINVPGMHFYPQNFIFSSLNGWGVIQLSYEE